MPNIDTKGIDAFLKEKHGEPTQRKGIDTAAIDAFMKEKEETARQLEVSRSLRDMTLGTQMGDLHTQIGGIIRSNPMHAYNYLTSNAPEGEEGAVDALRGDKLSESIHAQYPDVTTQKDGYKEQAYSVASGLIERLPKSESGAYIIDGYEYSYPEAVTAMQRVVEDTMHPEMWRKNAAYRDHYTWKTYGKNYKGYVEDRFAAMKPRLQALEAKIEEKLKGYMSTVSPLHKAPDMALLGMASAQGADKLRKVKDLLQSVEKNNLWRGLDEGFDALDAASLGISSLLSNVQMTQVLGKVYNDEPLTDTEQIYYDLWGIENELEDIRSIQGQSGWNTIGTGLGTTMGMAPSFFLGMGATQNIFKLSSLGVKGALEATKAAGKKGIMKGIGRGLLETGKIAGRSVSNILKAEAMGLIAAPFLPSTWSEFASKRGDQFAMENGKLVYRPKAAWKDAANALIEQGNELASEFVGGRISDVLGGSASMFGRMLGLDKWASKVGISATARRILGYEKPQWLKVFQRNIGYTGALSEPLSEVWGDVASNLMKSVITGKGRFDYLNDWEYWRTTLAVSAIYGGAVNLSTMPLATQDYSKKRKVRNAFLGKVKDQVLRDQLLSISAMDDIEQMSKELAHIDYTQVNNVDLAYGMDFLLADMDYKVAIGDAKESARMQQYKGVIQDAYTMAYRGVDGNTPHNAIVSAEVEDGTRYIVISGDITEGADAILMCLDANGNSVPIHRSKVKSIGNISLEDSMAEGYKKLFATDIEIERQQDIIRDFKALENPSAQDVSRVMRAFGVTPKSVGEIATLVDGSEVVVEGFNEESGKYLVKDAGDNLLDVPFYDILSEDALIAEAQGFRYSKDSVDDMEISLTQEEAIEENVEPLGDFNVGDIITTPSGTQGRIVGFADGKVMVDENTDNIGGSMREAYIEEYAPEDITKGYTAPQVIQEEVTPIPEAVEEVVETPQPEAEIKVVPVLEDGSVDYDSITDAQQFAELYTKERGTREMAAQDVASMQSNVRDEITSLEQKAQKATTPNERIKIQKEIGTRVEKVAFYGNVLDILAPQNIEEEQSPMEEPMEENGEAAEANDNRLGIVENDYSKRVDKKDAEVFNAFAEMLGLQVFFVDEVVEADGTRANAKIEGNKVYVGWRKRDRDKAISFLIGHEFTHRMQDLSPEEYEIFKDSVRKFLGEEKWNSRIARMQSAYRAQNTFILAEQIEDEVVADFVGELVDKKDVFAKYVEAHRTNKSLLEKIADIFRAIRDFLRTKGVEEKKLDAVIENLNTLIESAASAEATGNSQRERFSILGEQVSAEEFAEIEAERQSIIETAKANGTYLKAPNGKDTNLTPEQWVNVRTSRFKKWFGDWENDPRNASKIVDENGEPMVMIHGSPYTFTIFRRGTTDGGGSGRGIYFARAPKDVSNYPYGGEDSKKYLVFLNVRNLYDTDLMSVVRNYKAREFGIDDKKRRIPEEVMYAIIGASSYEEFIKNTQDSRFDSYKATIENISETTFNKIHSFFDGKGIFNSIPIVKKHLFRKDDAYLALTHDFIGEIVVRDPNQIKSATDNVGTYSASNDDIRYSIIGEQGASALDMAEEATIRMDNLAVAREMETEGKDAKAIRMATGWERGADGLWRYELEDYVTPKTFTNLTGKGKEKILAERNAERKVLEERLQVLEYIMTREYTPNMYFEGYSSNSQLMPLLKRQQAIADEYKGDKERMQKDFEEGMSRLYKLYSYGDNTFMLEEVIGKDHEIFKAYPELKDVSVEIEKNNGQDYGGDYNHKTKRIRIVDYKDRGKYEAGAIVHEIQHAIQYIEGFTLGINPKAELPLTEEQKKSLEVIREMTSFVDLYKDNLADAIEESVEYGNPIWDNLSQHAKTMLKYFGRRMRDGQTIDYVNESLKNMYESASVNLVGEDRYKKQAGEVEARNVSTRINMTPEERRVTLLSETEDVAREDQIFLREGAEMAMAKNVGLPKEEYAKLASTIMTRQHTYGRPPFDYAFTDGSFYVYDYLGDGDSIINFAMPIVGNEDLIQNITNSIDNGTITDTRSLDLYAENLQGKQRVNYRRFADAFKKRHGNRGYGVTFRGDSASNGGTYFEDSKRIGGDATTRGTSGNIDESANQELTTRFSLITPEMDAAYLDAVERGDMETAQRMVMEAAKLAMPNTKVVDENGNPKVVYHQTNATVYINRETGQNWDELDWRERMEWDERDDWDDYWEEQEFNTFSRVNARTTQELDGFFFAPEYDEYHEYGDRTIEAFLNIENPASREDYNIDSSKNNAGRDERIRLQNEGYDGVIREEDGTIWEYVAFSPNQIKSAAPVTYDDAGNVIPLSERFNPAKEDIRYSIIGEIGAANLDTYGRYGSPMLALEMAREFEAEGKTAREIRLATNWERGKDGKWRYEIMDGVYSHPQDDDITAKEYRLADILDNPDLYKAYPYLKDLKVSYNAEMTPNGRYNGKGIELKSTRTPEQINSTLIHEVQHAIQYAEMFAKGGSVKSIAKELVAEGKQLAEEFKNTPNVDIIRKGYLLYQIARKAMDSVKADTKATEAYRSLAGEVEARNTQKRMGMTEDERLETLLSATEDVARDAQRMLFYEAKGGADRGAGTRYNLRNTIDALDNDTDIEGDNIGGEGVGSTTEEQARVYLKHKHYVALDNIRKRFKRLRDIARANYKERERERRDRIGSLRTNAAKIDYILGELDELSLPLEHQALVRIARGEIRIKWENSEDGTKRGIAAEVGLGDGERRLYTQITDGATLYFDEAVHQWWQMVDGYARDIDTQDLRNALIEALSIAHSPKMAITQLRYIYNVEETVYNDAIALYDHEEELEIAAEKSRYDEDIAEFEANKDAVIREYEERASFFDAISAISGTVADLRKRIDQVKEKAQRRVSNIKSQYREMRELIARVKAAVKDAMTAENMRSMQNSELRRLVNRVDKARSINEVENILVEVESIMLDASIRTQRMDMDRMLRLRLPNGESVEMWVNEQMSEGKLSAKEGREILDNMWKGKNASGVSIASRIDGTTAETLKYLQKLISPTAHTKMVEDAEAVERGTMVRVDGELKLSQSNITQNEARMAELEEKKLKGEAIYTSADAEEYTARSIYDLYLRAVMKKQDIQTILENIQEVEEMYYGNPEKKSVRDHHLECLRAEIVEAKKQYLEALKTLNEEMLNLMRMGREALRSFRAMEQAHKEHIVKLGLDALGVEVNIVEKPKTSAWDRTRAFVRGTINAPYWTFQTTLKEIDHLAPNGEGDFYNHFMYGMQRCSDQFYVQQRAHIAEVAQKMRTLLKKKGNDGPLIADVIEEADSKIIATITYGKKIDRGEIINPETYDLTISNAMYLIAMWRQPRYQQSMLAHGITQEAIDAVYEAIEVENAGYIPFMNWVNNTFLPDTRLMYDKVHKQMFGVSMAEERNYFPARVIGYEEKQDISLNEVGMLPSTITGAVVQRVRNTLMPDFRMNYFKVLMGHLADMDQWSSYAPMIRDLNALCSNTLFREKCNKVMQGRGTTGDGSGSLFQNFKTTAAIAVNCYRPKKNIADDFIIGMLRGWAGSNIAFRGWTAIKQITSSPIFGLYMLDGTCQKLYVKNMAYGIANMRKLHTWALENSPSYKQRWESKFAGMDVFSKKVGEENGYGVHSKFKSSKVGKSVVTFNEAMRKFAVDFGLTPNAAVDAFSVMTGLKTIYDYELQNLMRRDGVSEPTEGMKKVAILKAEVAFNSTQQSGENIYLSQLQKDRTFASSVLTVYLNSSFGFHRLRVTGAQELWKQRYDEKYLSAIREKYGDKADEILAEARAKALSQLSQGIVGDLLFALMSGGGTIGVFTMFGGDDDEGEIWDETKKALYVGAVNILTGGYLAGSIVSNIIQGYEVSLATPFEELVRDFQKAYKLWQKVYNEEVSYLTAFGHTMNIVAKFGYGLDLETFSNIVVGLTGLFDGSGGNEAVMNILNVPQSQIKMIAGRRREGETSTQYITRIRQMESAWLSEDGSRDRELENEYNTKALRKDIVTRVAGARVWREIENLENDYKDVIKKLGWTPNARPNNRAWETGVYVAPVGDITEEEFIALQSLQDEIAYSERYLTGFAGTDENYYALLKEITELKNEIINKYEQFK